MTKNEWLEYFQLVNGRQASLEEVKQALESGDFQAEDVADAPQVAEAASLGTETEPVTDLDQAKEVCPSPQVPFSSESSQAGQVEVGPIQNQGEAPAPSSFGPAESPLAQAEPLLVRLKILVKGQPIRIRLRLLGEVKDQHLKSQVPFLSILTQAGEKGQE